MFKTKFKYFKSKCPPPDLSEVIDFSDAEKMKCQIHKRANLHNQDVANADLDKYGLKPLNQWSMFELIDKPGFIIIPNPFTATGQRYWICRCLRDFTQKPISKLNIDAHGDLGEGEDWWETCCKSETRGQNILKKLRWATLGYHHNWESKVYSEDDKDPFPQDLAELSRIVASSAGFSRFSAEAAIVNFYHFGSTLSGHTDHSEQDVSAPLLSFSFGQSAVFLIGGQTVEDPATPVLLRSGDVVVMSGCSRLSYHGVPLILRDDLAPWGRCEEESWLPFDNYVSTSRINLNVRQVLPSGQNVLHSKT